MDTTPSAIVVDVEPLTWGESARWDERRQRLYFVDCAAQKLHWLDGAEPPLRTMGVPGTPTGLVLTEGDALIVCLDDGLHLADPDRGETRLLAPYPPGMRGRANDAHADGGGGLITGTLNLTAGPGSLWRFGPEQDWTRLDDGVGNTNGPQVVDDAAGAARLIVSDTLARASYSYAYDRATGRAGEREIFADFAALGGAPDGAAVTADGSVWTCVVGAGAVARFGRPGAPTALARLPVAYPTDAAYGGPGLDRLYVTSIALEIAPGVPPGPQAGRLLAVDGTGRGRPEPRFALEA